MLPALPMGNKIRIKSALMLLQSFAVILATINSRFYCFPIFVRKS